ncbi:MAG: DNA primase [Actinomycetota bacterium]|nr:DNA primase [Actinomycetota bacterium]
MAGRIRQDDIEAVRDRTDIVKVVSQYLTLRKAGHDSLVGLCPFHTEKTPSFSVSPTKQVYYCFGCQAGGDAVRFLRDVENLTFAEVIERLARDAGITLRYEAESPGERRAQSRRQSLHRANAEASELYHRTLLDGPEASEARAYLAGRGFDQEAVVQFQIGYAPGYPDFLLRRLSPRFGSDTLVEAGLALKDGSGAVRDRFRGRITFPVHDLSGQAVGIGARLVASVEGQPKYLNSPETPVYRKGKVLYNLNRAKAAVTRSGQAVVVEGYTDVIALARAGVETAVATCGTALGEEHFHLLSRFAQRVVLAFDSDEAGARAAMRAYQFHETYPLETRVLVLPEGLDPADFVRTKGGEAFLELAGDAIPLVEYMLDRSLSGHDLRSVEGRARGVRAGLPFVAGLTDPVRREEYAHLLADRAGVSSSAVMLELKQSDGGRADAGPMAGPGAATRTDPDAPAAARVSPQDRVERQMLRMLAQSEEVFEAVAGEVSDEHFERAQHRRLFELLVKGRGDVRSLVAELDDERLSAALAALATGPVEGELTASHARRLALGLQENLLKRRIAEIRTRLQRLNPLTSPEYEALFEELIAREEERRKVHDQAEGA